jgi:hypothetical protein
MSAKRKRTTEELERLLGEQLSFLEGSAAAFDAGFEGEAKRLAVAIRVLLHNTPQSHALLVQLGGVPSTFVDTAADDAPGNLVAFGGLVSVHVNPGPARYLAMLDDAPQRKSVPFDKWWNDSVFRDGQGESLSRRNLVLAAANQDGGAHVDPSLNETYAQLSLDNSMGLMTVGPDGDQVPMPGPEGAALRQIAHELLCTLRPDYHCRPHIDSGVVHSNVQIFDKPPEGWMPIPRVGRNETCPCGSGVKYKRCHGR